MSCVPNVANVSGLSILNCPVGFLYRLFTTYSLSCVQCCPCFVIVSSVFSHVYLFLCYLTRRRKKTFVGVVSYIFLVNHHRKLSNPTCRPCYFIFHETRHISIIAFYYLVNISTKTGLCYIVRIIMTGY